MHKVTGNAPFCRCGQDTFLCQRCGYVKCGTEYGAWVKLGAYSGSVCSWCVVPADKVE